jgi:hypothetical protein
MADARPEFRSGSQADMSVASCRRLNTMSCEIPVSDLRPERGAGRHAGITRSRRVVTRGFVARLAGPLL